MGYTEKHKDIHEAIRDAKGGMRRYWNLMEDSRAKLGYPVGYIDVT
jgi:Cu2+-containing amine oxidase